MLLCDAVPSSTPAAVVSSSTVFDVLSPPVEPIVPWYSRRFVSQVSLNANDAVFVSIKGSKDDDDDVVRCCDEELDNDALFPSDCMLLLGTSSSTALPPRGTLWYHFRRGSESCLLCNDIGTIDVMESSNA